MMLHLPRICRSPILWDRIRAFSSTDQSSIRSSVSSILDFLSLKPGGTLVHNCGDSDAGKAVIRLAKERKLQTISIIEDKPGNPETIEELKALGGDIVVPESYTKTWYMKRLVNELTPTAGINLGEGYQATAVGKAVAGGGTLVSFRTKLPTNVVYDGAGRKSIGWDEFAKEKKLKIVNMYMKRLVNELTPAAGINLGEGYQATAVGKAVAGGGTLVSFRTKLPTNVVYDGAGRKSIGWDDFAKEKKLKIVNM